MVTAGAAHEPCQPITPFAPLIAEALESLDNIVIILAPSASPETLPPIVAVSAAFKRSSGSTAAELGGAVTLAHFFVPETRREAIDALSASIASRTRDSGEIQLGNGRDPPFWFGYHVAPVQLPYEAGPHSVLVGRDITRQMRRTIDDRATQRLFASAFLAVEAAAAIVTRGGRIVTATRRFGELLGYDARMLEGAELARLLDAASVGRIAEALAADPNGNGDRFPAEAKRHDATSLHVALTLAPLEGRAGDRIGVLTLRESDADAHIGAADGMQKRPSVGKIRLVGLSEVKAALGAKWPAVADRAILLAEGVIRRELAAGDVLSRAADETFLLWFSTGTVEENGERVARIARRVRIVLLTEFADAIMSSTSSAAASVPPGTPAGQAPQTVLTELDRRLSAPRDRTLEAARTYLAEIERSPPLETLVMYGRGGQPLPSLWCGLPADIVARLDHCAELLPGEAGGAFGTDILALRGTVALCLDAVKRGKAQSYFVPVRAGGLAAPHTRDQLMAQLKRLRGPAGGRLTLMLSAPFTEVSLRRLRDLADMVLPRVRTIGLMSGNLDDLPLEALGQTISTVAFRASHTSDAGQEAALCGMIDVAHRCGAKVIALGAAGPVQARNLLDLGVDFLVGVQPAKVLA